MFDTDVMVAAIRSDAGASRYLVIAALERRLSLLVSVPLMVEYESVMTRDEHLEAARLSRADVGILLDAIAGVATPVKLEFLWRTVLRDPDDDMVLETAMNGQADAIVTLNRRDFGRAFQSFGIDILAPGDALKRLGARI